MEKYLYFFFPSTLESMGIIALSLALARVQLRWGYIALAGIIFTNIIYLLRILPLAFGLHTLAAILLMVLLISKTTRVDIIINFISVLISFCFLGILEILVNKGFFIFTKLDYEYIKSNGILWMALATFQAVLMMIIALSARKLRKPVEGMWKI